MANDPEWSSWYAGQLCLHQHASSLSPWPQALLFRKKQIYPDLPAVTLIYPDMIFLGNEI